MLTHTNILLGLLLGIFKVHNHNQVMTRWKKPVNILDQENINGNKDKQIPAKEQREPSHKPWALPEVLVLTPFSPVVQTFTIN